jgi:hypothetical protein
MGLIPSHTFTISKNHPKRNHKSSSFCICKNKPNKPTKFTKHLTRSQSSRFRFGNEISHFKKKREEGEIQEDHKMKKLLWD